MCPGTSTSRVEVRPQYRVKALALDLDGVLVDSMPAIRAFWADWAGRRGRRADEVLAALHLTAEELVREFAPDLDAEAEARAAAVTQAQMETGIVAFRGSRELLRQLPRGRWAVVTSGRRELALRHLLVAGLSVPDVLITAEDTPKGKPDPACYVLAASRLRCVPDQCLAIEDSPAGIAAARRAGMAVLAVPNSHAREDLTEAHLVIDSLASLRVTAGPDGSNDLVVSIADASR